jgi:hypothetical protein
MANKVTTTNTTNKVVITPQSTKKITIDSGNGNNLTINQSTPNNIQITNNDVDTSLTPNNVSISSTDNNVSLSSTSTPVTVTQGTTSVVTVNTPGPQGPQGSGLTPGEDIEGRNITASGNISASGNIITKNLISPTNENTRIQLLENNLVFYVNAESFQSLNLTPSVTIFNSANDPNKDFKIGTGTTDDFFVIDSGDDTLTIAGNITASGDISASGDIFVTNINPNGTTLNIGSTSNPGILHIQGDVQTGAGAGSPHLKLEGNWHPVAELDITLSTYGAEYDSHLHEFKSDGTNVFSITGVGGVQVDSPLSIEAGTNRVVNLGGGQLGDGFRLRTGENLQTFNHTSFVYDWLEWTGTGADQGYKFHTYTHKNLITLDGNTANVEIGNNNTGSVKFLNGSVTASGDISSSGTIEGSILKGTLSTPTQTGITQVGTLTTLTVDNLSLNSNTLSSTSDIDVFISLGTNGIGFNATDNDSFTFNSAQNNVDFDFVGSSDQHLFYIDTSEDKTGIGTNTPGEKLEVVGNISASGTGSFEHLKLKYDTMPTADPNEKGVIYRSSSNGINNLLFISAGS